MKNNYIKNHKILVTVGGAGFIGSNLYLELVLLYLIFLSQFLFKLFFISNI